MRQPAKAGTAAGAGAVTSVRAPALLRSGIIIHRTLDPTLGPPWGRVTGKANQVYPREGGGRLTSPGLPDHHDLDVKAPDHDYPKPELAMVAHHILRHGAGQTTWPAFVF